MGGGWTMAPPPRAVVLGMGIGGLGVARSLGRAGVPVIGLWSAHDEVGRLSRYCRAVRAPAVAGDETLATLRAVTAAEEEKPALLPTTDAYAEWINERQAGLRDFFRFHTVDRTLFHRLNSKLSPELAREHGLAAPRTEQFEAVEVLEQSIGSFRFPVVVKPIDTFRRRLPSGVKNAVFDAVDPLVDYVRSSRPHLADMVFQEVVPSGDGHIHVCTVLCDGGGEPLLVYTGRKLRQYPPDYGVTCFGLSERNEELARLSTGFLRAIGYRGLCTLEFARDRETGTYVFIEANLRSYYHNQLFTDAGVDFALAEYRLLTSGERPRPAVQKEGIRWLDLPRDLGSYYRSGAHLNAGDWLRSVFAARSFAAFALDDPAPGLYETGQLARRLWELAARRGRQRDHSW